MAIEVVSARPPEGVTDQGSVTVGRRRRPGWADLTLALVAVGYSLSQTSVWPARLGWDEAIYFSQVSGRSAAFFSAPRARGITWLAWPLAQVSGSPHALRIYLCVLSGLALHLVYRVWFTVVPPAAAVLAAVLFGSLWITRFYGAELMPNLWVAFGSTAAVGGFFRLVTRARDEIAREKARGRIASLDRIGLVALPLGLLVAALMRPSDAAWVAAALLVWALVVPAWRRLPVLALIVAGGVLGAAPWVIEAYQRFGGVASRLDQASAIQGGLGWYPDLIGQHWKTIDGPALCRPCQPPAHATLTMYWVPVLVVLLLAAIVVARRSGRALVMAATVVAGLSLAVSYLLLVGYSAPRFMLPALAVLAVPAAFVLQQVLASTARPGPVRIRALSVAGAVVVVAALVAQVVAQQRVFDSRAAAAMVTGRWYSSVAAQLAQYGVRGPNCVVSGEQGPAVAYYGQCLSRNVDGHDASITADGLDDLARTHPVGVITIDRAHAPSYAKGWTGHAITGNPPSGGHWTVWVSLPS